MGGHTLCINSKMHLYVGWHPCNFPPALTQDTLGLPGAHIICIGSVCIVPNPGKRHTHKSMQPSLRISLVGLCLCSTCPGMSTLQLKTDSWPGLKAQTPQLFNCSVDIRAQAGALDLRPCKVGGSQNSGVHRRRPAASSTVSATHFSEVACVLPCCKNQV